jgi:hypothetical protein
MIEINDEIYRALADRLRDTVGTGDYFNGSVEIETDECSARLTTTLIVYRRTETSPEGVRKPITDIVPVWWELSTTSAGVPVENDFSFSELKPFLIDYE